MSQGSGGVLRYAGSIGLMRPDGIAVRILDHGVAGAPEGVVGRLLSRVARPG